MPTKAKTTVGKTPACLDKSGEDGHLGGGKIRQVECREDIGCEVSRHARDHDPVLPVTPCTVGMHPEAGQFDKVTGVEQSPVRAKETGSPATR
jgi:hypothetical protein